MQGAGRNLISDMVRVDFRTITRYLQRVVFEQRLRRIHL